MTTYRAHARRSLSGIIAGVVALTMLTLGATPAAAEEPTTGSISGTVVADGDGAPVAGARVSAQADDGSGVVETMTDADGTYQLEGLMPGDYVVHFEPSTDVLLAEYWNDARQQWRAERITIEAGSAITGIDARLTAVGSIAGTVTQDSDGSPIAGMQVSVTGNETGAWASATTESDGTYVIPGVPVDSYIVTFHTDGTAFVSEFWSDAATWDAAAPVAVAAGASVTGIDAALAVGGAIAGTVTRASDGTAVADTFVNALFANGEIAGSGYAGVNGEYRIDGLRAGDYVVQFGSPDAALVAEYWDNARSLAEATPVTVVGTQTVTGIDGSLDAAGYVSGTVTRASDGAPVSGIVFVMDVSGDSGMVGADVMEDGTYRAVVAPGTYQVMFQAWDSTLLTEYWQNARSASEATTVTVASEEEIQGIDAALDAAAIITGVVSLDSDEDREVIVDAYDGSTLVASAHASLDDGSYTLALPPRHIHAEGLCRVLQPQPHDGEAAVLRRRVEREEGDARGRR
ncbi:hypothetical protein QF046_002512 [Microbacterium sp. W4I4]|uniref:MSCRAMM family protein n=1 Tax=Microbacterium sp. W4I4 TaxID=3042295 RepID=UPI002784CDE8|nr:carboxypeptidase-like regulatory domain-containing protein [Microbacterium sp. W4I4]MDQ0614871.1 hypothetical protein [Microbacterium sp. W4I4]